MKIKLKDLTYEQYRKWEYQNCNNKITNCEKCIFDNVRCDSYLNCCWINHKELYSETFLDQEVEIADKILTDKEREYLRAVIKPFRDVITYIVKSEVESVLGNNYNFITIKMRGGDSIILPMFPTGKYYKNMEAYKDYTLKELEIYDND